MATKKRKIVAILPPAAPNPSTVELLERMLAYAKEGRLTFVCCVGQLRDGAIIDGWSNSLGCRPYSVIGALEAVKYEFARRNID